MGTNVSEERAASFFRAEQIYEDERKVGIHLPSYTASRPVNL